MRAGREVTKQIAAVEFGYPFKRLWRAVSCEPLKLVGVDGKGSRIKGN